MNGRGTAARWLLGLLLAAGWMEPVRAAPPGWVEVQPNLLRSAEMPLAYALLGPREITLIGAAASADVPSLERHTERRLTQVLLTHAHRDAVVQAADLIARGVAVRAARRAAPYLMPDGVAQYWRTSMPAVVPGRFPPLRERYWGDWTYLVVPAGIPGVDCTLDGSSAVAVDGWDVAVLETPGHTPDHLAFLAVPRGAEHPRIALCGDAVAAPGCLHAPYTTDWNHWQAPGLDAAADSLDKLAAWQPDCICPDHALPWSDRPAESLRRLAERLRVLAGLKSYEHFTKDRVGRPPTVSLLAPDQVATANEKPWTRLSEHLFLTGNTYAVASQSGHLLLVDPFSQAMVPRLEELRDQHRLGPAEVALISHAHNDHYTGLFALQPPPRAWVLDQVAAVVREPVRFLAPYADARSVPVALVKRDGEETSWREFRLRFHHLPGQTVFAQGVEMEIDGRRCLFTGDHFFHPDQFSGSGGWSGRNRGLPGGYQASAERVLAVRPDWVLAAHGGAFEFVEEDFRRRVRWAQAAAVAADAVSPSGSHLWDWDPHRVRVEPLIHAVRPGHRAACQLVAENPTDTAVRVRASIAAGPHFSCPPVEVLAEPGRGGCCPLTLGVSPQAPLGRHVVPLVVTTDGRPDGADVFLVIDVHPAAIPTRINP